MQISREEYADWREHPVTKAVREYLTELRADIMERWARGEKLDDEAQVYTQVYGDMIDMPGDETVYDAMEKFYAKDESDEQA